MDKKKKTTIKIFPHLMVAQKEELVRCAKVVIIIINSGELEEKLSMENKVDMNVTFAEIRVMDLFL